MNANVLDNLQRLLPEFYKAIGQTFVMVGVSAAPASTASSARWSALCAPFPSSSL